jgi:tetratricopeptide (TPR) repeat protein|tara:strand:- start:520 stop:954 length:435 start_codon:yes stop_codon:yes gene_type:complete
MKKNFIIIFIFILTIISSHSVASTKNSYFNDGKKLFDNKKYNESKFFFEKDIVFNPKSENSYLYLAKIFKVEENYNLEENNLNTVLLLNPRNEEAIYLLTLLNIKNSNFSEAKKLMISFNSVCKKICSSKLELQSKLDSSLKSE